MRPRSGHSPQLLPRVSSADRFQSPERGLLQKPAYSAFETNGLKPLTISLVTDSPSYNGSMIIMAIALAGMT